ncbi:hypothetical protein [uncultured Amphritea sp.]|uniref:hypothetical protein n=1 Tax=uncultured Amphritea sp. TaxID=981605 RepID=UPI00260C4CAF|nr:hypothetical protein [uncultured Amphritea sp.]
MKSVTRLISVAFSVLFICLSGFVLTGCGEEKSAAPPAINIQQIDPSNQQAFVRQMAGHYVLLSNQLRNQYLEFKAADDADGFVLYRNMRWTPEYIEIKTAYEKVFHDQKAYIYRQQLDGLFELFFGLHKLSVHLKHSLLEKDETLEQQVLEKLIKDQAEVSTYLLRAP